MKVDTHSINLALIDKENLLNLAKELDLRKPDHRITLTEIYHILQKRNEL